jgi:ABC-type amino acid transport substrate-binding protein
MRKLLATGALAVMALGIAAHSANAKAFTKITFGVDATYPPFESMSPGGQFVGFDIDLGKAICADLKVKCVFVSQGFDGIIPALEARKFDAILSSMSKTPRASSKSIFQTKCTTNPPA